MILKFRALDQSATSDQTLKSGTGDLLRRESRTLNSTPAFVLLKTMILRVKSAK